MLHLSIGAGKQRLGEAGRLLVMQISIYFGKCECGRMLFRSLHYLILKGSLFTFMLLLLKKKLRHFKSNNKEEFATISS